MPRTAVGTGDWGYPSAEKELVKGSTDPNILLVAASRAALTLAPRWVVILRISGGPT